jgi:hypothetical protein
MRRAALSLAVATLVAGPVPAQSPEPSAARPRPVGRITGGDALVKEKGRFQETWLHPDESLDHYSEIHLWNVAFQFR